MNQELYHATVLSNFARAFDIYTGKYCKSRIQESRFADRFFLLTISDLAIGIARAKLLAEKLQISGDQIMILKTTVDSSQLRENNQTGIGSYVPRSWITLEQVMLPDATGAFNPLSVEEAYARSLHLLNHTFVPYTQLVPRSVSFLPIASDCPAACDFCFSQASISSDQEEQNKNQKRKIPDFARIAQLLQSAQKKGAERAVITGGGEPLLLKHSLLLELIRLCRANFPKVVLITNGLLLGNTNQTSRLKTLRDYADYGLTTLAISRHHHEANRNTNIMKAETHSENIALTLDSDSELRERINLRWICVLQKGGIETKNDVESYLHWAAQSGAREICFKQLYVSSSIESVYYSQASNAYSFRHQVPLSVVTELASKEGWKQIRSLPWGSPVYEVQVGSARLSVAAYTEPSLFWERSTGLARSWNVMSDGRCFASLEDRASEVMPLSQAYSEPANFSQSAFLETLHKATT